ncbi:MAG: prohibitin family protein [Candidatus Bathyarchaeota archaeon]|nr:prohibitin family protein [Candidatus Bathyarchaeota archaeon]
MSHNDFEGRRYDIPPIPNTVKRFTGVITVLAIIALIGVVVVTSVFVRVPSGYRGVLMTFGKVEDNVLQEGLNYKVPFSQTVVLMNVQIQKAESTEATVTQDLQEVATTVAVNFRLNPGKVNEIYKDLRQDYVSRIIQPNIEESLKATTAEYRAEELVTKRAEVKSTFDDILEERLSKFHIDIVSVSLTDFQFSTSFSQAIEAKVIAEQQALQAKNTLEQIRHEAQQQIIQAEASRNATIAIAEGDALAQIIQANATAQAIKLITDQMTAEYSQYLWLQQWDGQLPVVYSGDQSLILDISQLTKDEG